MSPLFVIVLIIWAISAIALVVLVLMHSGKGAGLSETFGGSMDPNLGTGVIEKNLNRITIVCACIFIATLIAMMFIWPSNPLYRTPTGDDAAVESTEGADTTDLGAAEMDDEQADDQTGQEALDGAGGHSLDDGHGHTEEELEALGQTP